MWGGIYTALLTPFTKDNKVADKQLEAMVELNISRGVSGFYVGGSTAEAFLLSMDERKQILEVVTDTVKGRCKVISHIGCIGTDQAAELGKHAEQCGADAVSSVPPFYYKFGFDEIKDYYFDLADRVNLPMIVYNFPAFSGVTLTAERVSEFLSDDRFLGLKHTSNDLYALERAKRAFPTKPVYNGFDEMFMGGLAMGADGGIGSTYNVMAEKFVAIMELFHKGQLEQAGHIQQQVNDIIDVLIKTGVFQGEKYILGKMGIDCGGCRKPFKPLNEESKSLLDGIIAKYNLAGDN